ncbi:aminotransferase family protein-like protein [Hyaloscypha finlandica]|nr:aminotransferase family protein-like protein [Hyaloscypha finlandica]
MDKPKPSVPFGHAMRDVHFSFDKGYLPLNHGSFGTFPKVVRDRQRELQDLMEARPDTYLRYTYLELLEESRKAIAPLLGVCMDEVVFVPNATTGVNTILRNLVYQKGDVILHFATVYGACEKTIDSLCETTQVERVCIALDYPAEDEDIVCKFKNVVQNLKDARKNIKVAMFDTVLTFPGARFPWEALVKACKDLGILSLIDGAHGIGHIDLTNLGEVGPDFFTSNCYKWLFVPRGCAVLYVPLRNQHLIRTSLPTSWGFQPLAKREVEPRDIKAFGELFKKVSTIDPTPYVCVQEALKFRELVCGGEAKIREYCENVVKVGGKRMAEILRTEVMDNKTGTLHRCCFVNVRLPLTVTQGAPSYDNCVPFEHQREMANSQSMEGSGYIREADASKIAKWMTEKSVKEYATMIPVKFYVGQIWCRISGQIYLELEDFEWAGYRLKEMCERVSKGEFLVEDDQ